MENFACTSAYFSIKSDGLLYLFFIGLVLNLMLLPNIFFRTAKCLLPGRHFCHIAILRVLYKIYVSLHFVLT